MTTLDIDTNRAEKDIAIAYDQMKDAEREYGPMDEYTLFLHRVYLALRCRRTEGFADG